MGMKKSMMLVMGMMASAIVFAQGNQEGHKRGGRHESMKTVLSLDEKQDAAIRDINKKYADEYAELKKDSVQTREEKRKAGQALHEQRKNEIASVLTPEQNTKWKAHKEAQAAKRKEQVKLTAEKRDAKLKADLSLSDEQAAKIKTARTKFAEKAKTLRKDGKHDKEAFKKLRTGYDAEVKSILSAEQYQKWSAMKAERKNKSGRKKK